MPITPTYPGVYVEEIRSGVRTITGVGTSIAAFVGIAFFGPVNEPVTVYSFADFENTFGGLWYWSGMSYAVHQFFLNGGTQAVIVRMVPDDAVTGIFNLEWSTGDMIDTFAAATPGDWFDSVYLTLDHAGASLPGAHGDVFNVTFKQYDQQLSVNPNARLIKTEVFRNVAVDYTHPRYVGTVLANESTIARYIGLTATTDGIVDFIGSNGQTGANGTLSSVTVVGTGFQSGKKGMYALEKTDLFNLLCLPPITRAAGGVTWSDIPNSVWAEAATYAASRRAMLLVDPPAAWTKSTAISNLGDLGTTSPNAALYFPRMYVGDPLRGNKPDVFAPCGAVAGVIARTDAERGVWKAPAGIDARLIGATGLAASLTDAEHGSLNPLGINVLRALPTAGNVIWGARTMRGDDRLASDWKYLPVRRLALYIEESLYRGTQWVVFEPNDEPLWGQIRLNVGAFMHQLFRQGAFQGAKPSEAYFVKCDRETTTQDDINRGVVNIVVGFAPLKPAEFVVIKLQQMAGQIAA